MSTPMGPRSEWISVWLTPAVKQLLQQAALVSHKHVAEFLLDSGIMAAARALAERRLFLLDDSCWRDFVAALERPATDRPRLKRLLTEPGLLE